MADKKPDKYEGRHRTPHDRRAKRSDPGDYEVYWDLEAEKKKSKDKKGQDRG